MNRKMKEENKEKNDKVMTKCMKYNVTTIT